MTEGYKELETAIIPLDDTTNADYKALTGVVIGKRQAFEDELNALSIDATQDDIDSIVVAF